jgi:NADPH2:quinone reductase
VRAIQRVRAGHAELRDVEEPEPSGDDVILRVLYAAVNPFDMQVLRGEIGADPNCILTLGAEATGTVDGRLVQASGAGLGAGRDGTYAEAVAVPSHAIRPLPDGADPAKAATVAVAGRTAWRAVHQLARVGTGDVMLVLGASGGVGMFAAQLGRATGAGVLAHTAAEPKAERLRALGVEAVVAGSPEQLRERVAERGVSVVLDPLGGDYVTALMPVLGPAARIVTYGTLAGRTTELDLSLLYGKGLQIRGTSGATVPREEGAAALDGALRAVADGDVEVETETLALASAPEAFARLRDRSVTGKLILQP